MTSTSRRFSIRTGFPRALAAIALGCALTLVGGAVAGVEAQETSSPVVEEDASEGVARAAAPSAGPHGVESAELRFLGTRLHFLQAGEGGSLTVLLLHGGRYDAATWQKLGTLDFLAAQGYRALALDLPGHGESESSQVSPERFLTSLVPLISETPVVVITPSMSGRYALPLVTRRSGYVAGLVALAPVAIPEHLEALRARPLPALLVWGEDDTVVPHNHARDLAEALPDSELIILEEAGHAGYLAKPAQFHAALLAFLEKLGGT